MRSTDARPCPGCGLVLPPVQAPSHPYIGASAACWSLYGTVLASIYGNDDRRRLLQLVVDSYAVQHPGTPGRRSAQSVAIHLMTLCLCLEEGRDPAQGPRLHRRMMERLDFSWLEPPASSGSLTIADVAAARTQAEYESVVWQWAGAVWQSWCSHHDTVRSLLIKRGLLPGQTPP